MQDSQNLFIAKKYEFTIGSKRMSTDEKIEKGQQTPEKTRREIDHEK